jgi:hypothetical protein
VKLYLNERSHFLKSDLPSIQFIPSFQNEAAITVYAVLLLPLSFQDAEDFAGEVWAVYVLWIRNVAKIVIGLIVSIPNYRCLTPNSVIRIQTYAA